MLYLKGLKEKSLSLSAKAEVERPRKVLYDPSVLHHQCNNMFDKTVPL